MSYVPLKSHLKPIKSHWIPLNPTKSSSFSKANLEGAYFTNTILQAKNLKGAILTEALLPSDAIQSSANAKTCALATVSGRWVWVVVKTPEF